MSAGGFDCKGNFSAGISKSRPRAAVIPLQLAISAGIVAWARERRAAIPGKARSSASKCELTRMAKITPPPGWRAKSCRSSRSHVESGMACSCNRCVSPNITSGEAVGLPAPVPAGTSPGRNRIRLFLSKQIIKIACLLFLFRLKLPKGSIRRPPVNNPKDKKP